MQEECEEIYPAVLHNIMHGSAAERELNNGDTPFLAELFGPSATNKHSGKYNMMFLLTSSKFNVSLTCYLK